MTPLATSIGQTANLLLQQSAPHNVMQARRDAVAAWNKLGLSWQAETVKALRHAAAHGVSETPARAWLRAHRPAHEPRRRRHH